MRPGPEQAYHWSIHQLTEYLVAVGRPSDTASTVVVALERAIEALDAEMGALVVGDEVRGSVGFPTPTAPGAFASAGPEDRIVDIPGAGRVHVARGDLTKAGRHPSTSNARLVVGRLGEGYSAEEQQMLHGMALVLGLVLHNLEALQVERSRHQLVETLLAIQRAISARRPLDELLDAITSGASALLGRCPVTLLLSDPLNPGDLRPASTFDHPELDAHALAEIQEIMATNAARAGEPVPLDAVLVEQVVVDGEPVGCLAARPGRDAASAGRREYQELLATFAQQVSLALTDARLLEAMRAAHRDSITGLLNRTLFLERLEQERRHSLARGDDLTVLFIDLDRFKAVNDTLGHAAGDELLVEVAARITASARTHDTTARLGGDEFAVFLSETDIDAGRLVADRIISALARPFVVSGREVIVGGSVGIASLSAGHEDAGALLSDADVAMYTAKRSGRGRHVVFEPRMHDEVVNALSLRTDLQHAHHEGQLWLAYQPLVRLDTRDVLGAEALIRWNHPERGAVPPSEFIPIAEETDTILGLGAWAIREALAQTTQWRSILPAMSLSLNISTRQVVDPRLPALIDAALRESGLPAHMLTLEITESLLVVDPDLAASRLCTLKELGIGLSVDDFGTGYSSLAYLRRFPVDQVKIDRSFIAGLTYGAPEDLAIVRSIIELCSRLRLESVAEGVENVEQLNILAELGCDLGQGELFARPMPADDWSGYLTEHAGGARVAATSG